VWATCKSPQFAGAGLNFRSEQTPNRNPSWSAASFATADLMAEYTYDRYTIKANMSNVTNKLYAMVCTPVITSQCWSYLPSDSFSEV
jgi:catecholate siderophore receptor